MKLAVTDEGVLIPKEFLFDVDEVEIKRENNLIIVAPSDKKDPILGLGKNPVTCKIPDASENLDKYLYGSSE